MHKVYFILGSNEGNREKNLQFARDYMQKNMGELLSQSNIYETANWGSDEWPAHLNQAVAIKTSLSPEHILKHIKEAEGQAGRTRIVRWGPRTLDIDILFYDDRVVATQDLTIPHPLIAERRFVLAPLVEIAADYIHPLTGEDIKTMLARCPDPLSVSIWKNTLNITNNI